MTFFVFTLVLNAILCFYPKSVLDLSTPGEMKGLVDLEHGMAIQWNSFRYCEAIHLANMASKNRTGSWKLAVAMANLSVVSRLESAILEF